MEPPSSPPTYLGAVIIILGIVLSLVVIGLLMWGLDLKRETATPTPTPTPLTSDIPITRDPENANARATVNQLETLSTSDEMSAITADLESTNLDLLQPEFEAIEAVLAQ